MQSALTTTFGEDCPIAPMLDYVSVPEEVSGAVGTVSASIADVNKVTILTLSERFDLLLLEFLHLLQLRCHGRAEWHQRPTGNN